MKSFIMVFMLLSYVLAGFDKLHEAVMFKKFDTVKSLIEDDGVEVDAVSGSGLTALHIAIKARALEIADYLLEQEADIDAKDKNGYTPLHLAVKKKRLDLVRFVVNSGANLDVTNKYGISPLHQAAFSGELEIVEFLVNKGADPLIKNLNGSTAYDLAVAKRNDDVASFLEYYNGE